MNRLHTQKIIACFLFVLTSIHALTAEENFLLINGTTDEIVLELGPHVDERMTPCSTFKIALSLMGFDAGILKDQQSPTWLFQDGYDDFLEAWKAPQTPRSWMKYSCIWYSDVLVSQLGFDTAQNYLSLFGYGNHDMSGGLTGTCPWVNSSVKISVREQVVFIQKMLICALPVSTNASQMTKEILFVEELPGGWKLYGKTGWGGSVKEGDDRNCEIGWFVGWVEKDGAFFPFAYNIRERQISLGQRIPRVKQLILSQKP
jgi:beta-lactamase class D